jgi:hypothetical protein
MHRQPLSHESVLLNYPFVKMVANRLCHLLISYFWSASGITNNLSSTAPTSSRSGSNPPLSANLEPT